jgi:hypothetical protein
MKTVLSEWGELADKDSMLNKVFYAIVFKRKEKYLQKMREGTKILKEQRLR